MPRIFAVYKVGKKSIFLHIKKTLFKRNKNEAEHHDWKLLNGCEKAK